MHNHESAEPIKTRKPELEAARNGIIRPKGSRARLFSGWGPRLLTVAFATCALGASTSVVQAPAFATTQDACTAPQQDAILLSSPVPETPPIAQAENASGEAVILIELTASGDLHDASVAKSSGNLALDAEAMRVARASHYAPARSNCEYVPSTYLYEVNFAN
jgi:TonB family protein